MVNILRFGVFLVLIVVALAVATGALNDFGDFFLSLHEGRWAFVAAVVLITLGTLTVFPEIQHQLNRTQELRRAVSVRAIGIPAPGTKNWRNANVDPANRRLRSIAPFVAVIYRSDAEHQYLLTDLYLDLYDATWWRRLLRRTEHTILEPEIIAHHQVPNPRTPRRVNWVIAPESPEQRWDVDFGGHWVDADGPKWGDHMTIDLIVEFGSPRRLRVPIVLRSNAHLLPEPNEWQQPSEQSSEMAERLTR